jgi:hypothetical protein
MEVDVQIDLLNKPYFVLPLKTLVALSSYYTDVTLV